MTAQQRCYLQFCSHILVLNSDFWMVLYESSHRSHAHPVAVGSVCSVPVEMALRERGTRPFHLIDCEVVGEMSMAGWKKIASHVKKTVM